MAIPATAWAQIDGETDKAFAAFNVYLELGPHERSLKATALRVYGEGRGKRNIDAWSAKNRWVDRARAYDAFMIREQQNEGLKQRRRRGREAEERHAEQTKLMMAGLLEPAAAFLAKITEDPEALSKLGVKDLAWLSIHGAKTWGGLIKSERLSLGMDADADEALTLDEFQILVRELREWMLKFVPATARRDAGAALFRLLRKFGVRSDDMKG